ncbi:unnamed protein product [Orchesella dallaii]|uniref:Protein kinase domain-containing protein n=1 Tax=Orchesella dallaii TaxID=48710 RepID=A0ABP1Q5F7_9HEXA
MKSYHHHRALCNVLVLTVLFTTLKFIPTIRCNNLTEDNKNELFASCLRSPEAVQIECHLVKVANASCVKDLAQLQQPNIISIPQIPGNQQGEINCTSPSPIELSFGGFQLDDYVSTSYVRNAENVFNEATFVFSVSFPLSQVTSSREVIVSRYNSDQRMSFFLFRPGNKVFPSSLGNSSAQVISLEHQDKNVIIPCVSNDPSVIPILESSPQVNVTATSYQVTTGFLIGSGAVNPDGRYSCRVNASGDISKLYEESAVFQFKSRQDAIFQPQTDMVYLFANSELHISCKYGERVVLDGNFKSKPITPKTRLSTTSLLEFESEYIEKIVRVGDSGTIQCSSNDGKVLKAWKVETLDIQNNPVVQLTKVSETQISCESSQFSIDKLKLQVVFCQGISECKLNEFCFDKDKGKHCANYVEGIPCNHSTKFGAISASKHSSLCVSLPQNVSSLSQGMIRCSAGDHTYQTNYFKGFDNKLYLDWTSAPVSAMIDIFVPNVTMYPHNSYPFGCRATKFISDGKLQWVIRGKDGSEILLHKNRVQDLYGIYANDLDYKLYTVRESNIRLIYPNDYDVICMVPRWNGTAWVRHHRRINVAAKEAPVTEIVSVSVSVILLLICVVVYVMWRLKKAKDAIRCLTEKEVQEFLEGNPEALKNASDKDAHEVVDSLPYDKKFEIPREKLLIDTENCLGKGAFGTVLKGRVEGISDVVAVKTINNDCEVNRFKGFLSELKIMIYIGRHPNIVSLIGASTEKIKEKTLYIVVEFCANGSLEDYLRKNKSHVVDQRRELNSYENLTPPSVTSDISDKLTSADLIRWSYQTAVGMEYLAKKKVVHADLAARNVLIDNRGNAKITDFGLSRQLFDYAQYVKKQQEPLPWRWMAIESLQQLRFSTQSDVWAYGILLYEIFSIGDIPYPGLAWDIQFVHQLCDGLRLSKPHHATDAIYNLMLDCWQDIPENRPNFSFIAQYFRSLLETLNMDLEASKDLQPTSEISYTNALMPGYMRVSELLQVDSTDNRKSTNIYTNS